MEDGGRALKRLPFGKKKTQHLQKNPKQQPPPEFQKILMLKVKGLVLWCNWWQERLWISALQCCCHPRGDFCRPAPRLLAGSCFEALCALAVPK